MCCDEAPERRRGNDYTRAIAGDNARAATPDNTAGLSPASYPPRDRLLASLFARAPGKRPLMIGTDAALRALAAPEKHGSRPPAG